MKTNYFIRWTKYCNGEAVPFLDHISISYDKWTNINQAYKGLEKFLKEEPQADGYIEEVK